MGKRNSEARRQVAAMIKNLRAQGWTIEKRGKGYKATPPGGGGPVFFHETPSDTRGVLNLRAIFRQRGADL